MACYGSGLRIAKAVSLKAVHIDSDRMLFASSKAREPKIGTPFSANAC